MTGSWASSTATCVDRICPERSTTMRTTRELLEVAFSAHAASVFTETVGWNQSPEPAERSVLRAFWKLRTVYPPGIIRLNRTPAEVGAGLAANSSSGAVAILL